MQNNRTDQILGTGCQPFTYFVAQRPEIKFENATKISLFWRVEREDAMPYKKENLNIERQSLKTFTSCTNF